MIYVTDAAVFSNDINFKKYPDAIPLLKPIIIDYSRTRLVDHTVMEHLHHFENDYISKDGKLEVIGLEKHKSVSMHPLAARKLIITS